MQIEKTIFSHLLPITCLLAALLILTTPLDGQVSAKELVVKIRPFREKNIDVTQEYKYQVLELILAKTEATDGPFRIVIAGDEMIKQSRVIDLVNQGELSLIMTMTSRQREEAMLPVRIPIYKGLFGYRIFIIRSSDREKFTMVTNRQQLQNLWAGLGHDWPDLQILKHNGFNTVGGANYRGLFAMLQEGRFDYFPRGLPEPWREVVEEEARDITVEPTLLLHYYAPAYFFVSRTNPKLAERIERGFEMAIGDGSFQQLFDTHWYIQNTLKKADLKNRRVFRLTNPLLTPETPLKRKELWFTP